MRLRAALPSDRPLLERWDRQPHVVAASGADHDHDWAYELSGPSPHRDWLIAESEGRPVGVLQVIDPALEETHYWGEIETGLRALDIWIGDAADLGHGHGTRMMHLVLDRCFAEPEVSAVLLDPMATNIRAHRFYERLGFRCLGPRRFGEDDCLVYRLERQDWEGRTATTGS